MNAQPELSQIARGRVRSLDGVRALAIAAVMAAHILNFKLGWAGVDLFFVLSGYLITGILRKSRNDQTYWRSFYLKRCCRILPPLTVAILGAALFYRIDWHSTGWYYVFFLANVGEWLHPGAAASLGVLWSLAVEEHFYLMWPFAVRFIHGRRHLLCLLGGVILVEPILRAAVTPWDGTYLTVFLLTPFRLDAIASGSLLAILMETPESASWLRHKSSMLLAVCTLGFAALSWMPLFSRQANSTLFNSIGYSLIGAIGFFLIASLVTNQEGRLTRTLSYPRLVYLGTISYGLYLYHPLAIALMDSIGVRIGFHHNRVFLPVTVLLSIGMAALSYSILELPIMGRAHSKTLGPRAARTTAA